MEVVPSPRRLKAMLQTSQRLKRLLQWLLQRLLHLLLSVAVVEEAHEGQRQLENRACSKDSTRSSRMRRTQREERKVSSHPPLQVINGD